MAAQHVTWEGPDPMTVDALRRRQPASLDALLGTYGREIQAVAYLILRDRDAAEDVVVETILAAFERAGQLRDERALRTWILRIATNKALTARRRGARVVRLEVVPDRVAPGDFSAHSTSRIALLAGVGDLPPQMRAAVVLRYYADLPVEDVAIALGKSPNTIKAQLQTALDRLRIALADPAGGTAEESRHA
jgi:RNA polymerase sigma-70 factor (ECF subfamily)